MKKGIKRNVLQRVNANRRRVVAAHEREDREAEAIRALNKQTKNTDVVAEMCASVIRVRRID